MVKEISLFMKTFSLLRLQCEVLCGHPSQTLFEFHKSAAMLSRTKPNLDIIIRQVLVCLFLKSIRLYTSFYRASIVFSKPTP